MDASSTSDKPSVYLLHGDDVFAMGNFIDALRQRMGDPSIAGLNFARLDGRQVSEDDIRTAVNTLPFLAERRLVALNHPLARFGGESGKTRFLSLLDGLSPTTALVLVVEDQIDPRRKGWVTLHSKHWLWKWVADAGGRAFSREFRPPRPVDMPAWIRSKANDLGGEFNQAAALELANQVGNNTQLAAQEIEKLLTYVDGARPVESKDVTLLTAPGGQWSIFDLVDALALGNAETALRVLHNLLEEQETAQIFAMVIRQFRLLIEVREILDEGGSSGTVATDMGQAQFVADKLVRQAQRFSMTDLSRIYHRLLDLDVGMKTSLYTPELALDVFIAELAE